MTQQVPPFDELAPALAETIARYRARNPGSERLLAEAADVLPAGNTRSVLFYAPFPPYIAPR